MTIHRGGAESAEEKGMKEITEKIIGAAIEVHKTIGPGLLESAYEEYLAHEMRLRGLAFQRQVALPVAYKGVKLDCGYRLDFLVENAVVLELKAVDGLQAIHEAQVLTYLKLGGWTVGLLINFNVPVLRNGIKRIVLNYKECSAPSAPLR
jgi:GxxExxY protein